MPSYLNRAKHTGGSATGTFWRWVSPAPDPTLAYTTPPHAPTEYTDHVILDVMGDYQFGAGSGGMQYLGPFVRTAGATFDAFGMPRSVRMTVPFVRTAGATFTSVPGITNAAPTAAGMGTPTADLLLHGDGGEGSSAFTDSSEGRVSAGGKAVTGYGGIVQRSASAKYGTSGIQFVALSSQYLSLADDAAWDILAGSGNFFIEMWARTNAPASGQVLLTHRQDDNNRWGLSNGAGGSGSLRFFVISGGSSLLALDTPTSVFDGNFSCLAVERYAGNVYIYKNGAPIASTAFTGSPTFAGPLNIGSHDGTSYFLDGDIDEIVLRRGHCAAGLSYTPFFVPYAR